MSLTLKKVGNARYQVLLDQAVVGYICKTGEFHWYGEVALGDLFKNCCTRTRNAVLAVLVRDGTPAPYSAKELRAKLDSGEWTQEAWPGLSG